MTFTDDDLKRLKEMVLNCEAFYGMNQPPIPLRLSTLLARLEAAEKALDHNVPTDPDYIAWRKAAGK